MKLINCQADTIISKALQEPKINCEVEETTVS